MIISIKNTITRHKTKIHLVLDSIIHGAIYPILIIVAMKIADQCFVEVSFWDFVERFLEIVVGGLLVRAFSKTSEKTSEYCLFLFGFAFSLSYLNSFVYKMSHLFLPITAQEICSSIIFTTGYAYIYYNSRLENTEKLALSYK
jgi:hypothetical protein